MSKCVRSALKASVERVSDEKAAVMVANHNWEYCSKTEWKAFNNKKETTNVKG